VPDFDLRTHLRAIAAGGALSEADALHLAEALHAALATGEVMPHQLLHDDPDAEERLELFMELCESGALLEK